MLDMPTCRRLQANQISPFWTEFAHAWPMLIPREEQRRYTASMSISAVWQGASRRHLQICRPLAISRRGYSSQDDKTPTTESKLEHSEIATPAPKDVLTAEVMSGAPEELRRRVVRVYQPARNTMQSGGAKGNRWRIDWDVLTGAGRWENPLMGWASSADYMQGTRISFRSKEDAIHFAEKQGWDYYVQQPTVERIPPKNYAENFAHIPGKIRLVRTK